MALINCTECGKEISDSAKQCPHCGSQTKQGKRMTEAKFQGVSLLIYLVMCIVGAILFLPNFTSFIPNLGNEYFWDAFQYSDDVKKIVYHSILGAGLLISGTFGLMGLNKRLKKEQVDMITEPSPEETFPIIDAIPAAKQQYGNCQKCGEHTSVAVCRVRDLPYDYKLCLDCINRYGARFRE